MLRAFGAELSSNPQGEKGPRSSFNQARPSGVSRSLFLATSVSCVLLVAGRWCQGPN